MTEDRNFIKALGRGMAVLTVLNQYNGLDMQALMARTGHSRSGLYRILETLIAEGYVQRSDHDKRYRLTSLTRTLSAGYVQEPWIRQFVIPIFTESTDGLLWPAALSIWRNGALRIECSSAHPSTFTVRRAGAGWDADLLKSASGTAFLSALSTPQAGAILSTLSAETAEEGAALKQFRAGLENARQLGFAAYEEDRFRSIAVPVHSREKAIGALALQGETSTKWRSAEEPGLVGALKEIAERIESALCAVDTPANPA